MFQPIVLAPMVLAGLATVLGAAPLAVIRPLGHRAHDTVLGLAAGIMLGVVGLDLLPESLEHAAGDLGAVAVGVLGGGLVIMALVRALRNVPLPMPFVKNHAYAVPGAAFLVFVALAIHNAPEGLAVGLAYSGGLSPEGHTVATAIAAQNIPEGLLVSLAVFAETRSKAAALGYCLLSGLVEPTTGVLALLSLAVSPSALGVAFAFAAGAMLSVVLFQMIPESHRHGHQVPATLALVLGFLVVPFVGLVVQAFG